MGKAETRGSAQRNFRLQELPGRIVLGRDQIKTSTMQQKYKPRN